MALTSNQKAGAGAGILTASSLALASVFIPHWESGSHMDLTVRHQSFDPPGVYTVCDGITNLDPQFADIKPGMTFTAQRCKDAFMALLPGYAAPIEACVPDYKNFPPHRQVALLSFAYNLGPGRICNSAIARELNAKHWAGACNLMGGYVKAAGKRLKGLQNRRFDPKWGEIAWCLRED